VRVQTVTDEFDGKEKIDIIQWNKDDKLFIIAALSPAKVTDVELNREEKKAKITVDESQAPLAIGKSGVNVNLASRLTGYTLDIVQTKSSTPETKENPVETKPQA
jgi:N utilization substance protein A